MPKQRKSGQEGVNSESRYSNPLRFRSRLSKRPFQLCFCATVSTGPGVRKGSNLQASPNYASRFHNIRSPKLAEQPPMLAPRQGKQFWYLRQRQRRWGSAFQNSRCNVRRKKRQPEGLANDLWMQAICLGEVLDGLI